MAKKTTRKKRKFKGAVARNAQKQARGSKFSYLNLPKSVSEFKEEPGSRVNLDILPYEVTMPNHPDRDDEYEIAVPGGLWYKRPFWIHRNIGPDNMTIVCPSSEGKKCPICQYRANLLKEGAEWDDDSVRALKASMRNLYWVIPKGSKKYDEEPHVWDISQFLFQEKLNEEIQESEEYETFPDLEDGYTLRIRFSEESFGKNKFADTSRIDFKERTEAYPESILDKIPSLDDLLEIKSYKAIEAIFFGGLSPDEAEEAEAEEDTCWDDIEPPWEEESEEDNDEEDEYNGDEEDEYDDEDDGEDEEEPEPTPKKNTKKGSKSGMGRKPPKKTKSKDKCPYGYAFGTDCEEYDECDECDLWEECLDASEAD